MLCYMNIDNVPNLCWTCAISTSTLHQACCHHFHVASGASTMYASVTSHSWPHTVQVDPAQQYHFTRQCQSTVTLARQLCHSLAGSSPPVQLLWVVHHRKRNAVRCAVYSKVWRQQFSLIKIQHDDSFFQSSNLHSALPVVHQASKLDM